jgi:hypothetical protein
MREGADRARSFPRCLPSVRWAYKFHRRRLSCATGPPAGIEQDRRHALIRLVPRPLSAAVHDP